MLTYYQGENLNMAKLSKTFDPVGALDRHARRASRQWKHDRSSTVGASEIGQCARKVFFLKNEGNGFGRDRDAEHDDRWGARVPGVVYEDKWWVPAMRREARRLGGVLMMAGKQQATLARGFLSATPDGVVGLPLDERSVLEFALECKTRDPRARQGVAKPEHVYQVQVQLGLIREATAFRPGYGLLMYTDRAWWDDVEVHRVDYDPSIYEAAKQRARDIMSATEPGDLKPEGVIAGGDECQYCPFREACGAVRATAVPPKSKHEAELGEADRFALAGLAARIRLHEQEAERAAQAKGEAAEAIKALLRAAGARKASVETNEGTVRVSYWSNDGGVRYDDKAIREAAIAAGVDVSQYEKPGNAFDVLKVDIKPRSTSGA